MNIVHSQIGGKMQNHILRPKIKRRAIQLFTPIKVIPKGLEVDPYLLANMCDLAEKWGEEDTVIINASDGRHEVCSKSYTIPGEQSVKISFSARKKPLLMVTEEIDKDHSDFLQIICPRRTVLWDSDLSFSEVEQQIELLHQVLAPLQLISPRTQRRVNMDNRLYQIMNKRYQSFASIIEQFTPPSIPKALGDITPELIADIYDLILKFGYEDINNEEITYSFFEPQDGGGDLIIGHCDNIDPLTLENGLLTNLVFCRCCNCLGISSSISDESSMIEIPVNSGTIETIDWDAYLEPSYIESLIEATGIPSMISGRTDPLTCLRRESRIIVQLVEFYVEELFPSYNTVISAQQLQYDEPEDVIIRLDQPDEVRFIRHELVGFLMVHRRSIIDPEQYIRVMEKVFHRHGIMTQEDAWGMIDIEIKHDDLVTEIDEELAKIGN